jgi:hypothetical protein
VDHFTAFDRVLSALRFHGCRVQLRGDRARVTCPTHADRRESLALTYRGGKVLMRCFAGCRAADVLGAIGLRMADLFDATAPRVRAHVVATYSYTDIHGVIVAEKVRLEPKAFAWRRPDASARGGYRWGLDGIALPLYRLPALIDASEVLMTEGEKAADLLTRHGFTATCPPAGASTWADRWTAQLADDARCARLIVLPDADREGIAHARHVAAACAPWMRVVIVTLPNLSAKGDIVDYFDAGHTADDLRRLIDGTPDWTPDADERERANRRREKTRERVKRHREKQKARNAVNVSSAA